MPSNPVSLPDPFVNTGTVRKGSAKIIRPGRVMMRIFPVLCSITKSLSAIPGGWTTATGSWNPSATSSTLADQQAVAAPTSSRIRSASCSRERADRMTLMDGTLGASVSIASGAIAPIERAWIAWLGQKQWLPAVTLAVVSKRILPRCLSGGLPADCPRGPRFRVFPRPARSAGRGRRPGRAAGIRAPGAGPGWRRRCGRWRRASLRPRPGHRR